MNSKSKDMTADKQGTAQTAEAVSEQMPVPELETVIVSELDRLYRFAHNRVRDEYKAEEIVQDIVLTAYRAYPRLKDRERTVPWLWGIARNVTMRAYKPAAEIAMDEVMIIQNSGVSYETPESEYLRKCDIAKVRKAVSFLAKAYRDVCVLYYLEGKDYNTISEELGIPLSSVKWRLNQTKSQLREEITNMDYMENGYRKAIPLKFNMGGWVGKWDRDKGAYDGADKALEGLLPQNICIIIRENAKTVTEIASDLGVAADYVEEALQKMVDTKSVKKVGNKYQAMFPIWDGAVNKDVFQGNVACAKDWGKVILDMVYGLEKEILDIGFYGADKGLDKLILFLIGFLCENTADSHFETDKLPFAGDDKAWFILATTAKEFHSYYSYGLNSNGSWFGLREYYFVQEFTEDNRSQRTEEQKAFCAIYRGEEVTDEYSLSKLLESGKVVKEGDTLRITVPVLSTDKGERDKLLEVLAPVLERTNALQHQIRERSYRTVQKYIPKHIAEQADFFGGYCAQTVLAMTLFEELKNRGVEITQDMATWYEVK